MPNRAVNRMPGVVQKTIIVVRIEGASHFRWVAKVDFSEGGRSLCALQPSVTVPVSQSRRKAEHKVSPLKFVEPFRDRHGGFVDGWGNNPRGT